MNKEHKGHDHCCKSQQGAYDLDKDCCREEQSECCSQQNSFSHEPCGSQKDSSEVKSQPTTDEEYKEKYLRLLAENENTRRRVQRESQEAIRYAAQKIILDLLDPFDNFEKALYHAGYSPSEDVRNWAIGFKMIHQQFKEWLSAQGVHSFVSKGQPFNAQLHEAVETVATQQAREGTVIEEYTKGYKMHDRVLRPAKVSIAKPHSSTDESLDDAEAELSPQELEQASLRNTNDPQQAK